MKRYKIDNFRQNTSDHKRLEPYVLYATLMDADTGELIINATMEYIMQAVEERGFTIVKIGKSSVIQITG